MKRTRKPKKERLIEALQFPTLIRKEINNQSFFEFFKYFWEELSNDELKLNWHIEYLCDELQDLAEKVAQGINPGFDYLIINVPPGTTKSTIVSRAYPIWVWTRWHWMKFITGSYSGALSLELAEDSRDLIRSEKFKEIYPELGLKIDKDSKSNFKVIKKDWVHKGQQPREHAGGGRVSTSVGGATTGFHGHILLVDDPLDPQRSYSKVELDKANKWIAETLGTRKADKNVSPIILIMQRLHQLDCTGHLLDTIAPENIEHICLPADSYEYGDLIKPDHLIDNYHQGLLDPIRLNRLVLQKYKRSLGQYGYAGQMGQKPTPPGGGMFQVDNLHTVERVPGPSQIVRMGRYWDKAGSKGYGAYTAGVKAALLTNGKILIVDVKRGQWASHEREQIIRKTAEADGVGVEIFFEQEPGSGGKESAELTMKRLIGFTAHRDLPKGDKVFRADPYSVQVNEGNVLLLHGAWNHEFVEEHRFFPYSKYKDQVDAAGGIFSQLVSGKQVEVY